MCRSAKFIISGAGYSPSSATCHHDTEVELRCTDTLYLQLRTAAQARVRPRTEFTGDAVQSAAF